MMESPRAWGWTVRRAGCRMCGRNPHARGDGPESALVDLSARNPHARGDGRRRRTRGMDRRTAPSRRRWNPHARGDGPRSSPARPVDARNPHARGDGPKRSADHAQHPVESPRAWGWTESDRRPRTSLAKESPRAWGWTADARRRGAGAWNPHARGDGPDSDSEPLGPCWNPHARGDGPAATATSKGMRSESPRAWGWTAMSSPKTVRGWNPHARGDGPGRTEHMQRHNTESPRAWGWTVTSALAAATLFGIPTRVGMDRLNLRRPSVRNPHARGDGPDFIDAYNP